MAPTPPAARRPLHTSALVLALAAGYYLAAQAALQFSVVHQNISPLWLPAGVALAGLIVGGIRLWPGVLVGAVAAARSAGLTWEAAALIGVGNTGAALLGASICRDLRGVRAALTRLADAFRFGVAAAVGAAVSATVGVLALGAGAGPGPAAGAWEAWWAGDLFGGLLAGSLIMAWSDRRWPAPRGWAALELAAAAAVLAGTGWAVYYHGYPRPSLVYPALLWIALRFGLRGGTVAALFVAVIAAWTTAAGRGPLLEPDPAVTVEGLQIIMGVAALIALVVGAVTDERAWALRDLQLASEARRALIDTSPLAIIAVDLDDRVTAWNPGAERIFGWTAAEAVGQPLPILPAEDDAPHRGLVGQARAGAAVMNLEAVRRTRDGRLIDVAISAAPLRGRDGRVAGVMGILEDISARKSIEFALRESEARLHAALESLPFEFWICDRHGRHILQNAASVRRWGPMVGQRLEEMPVPEEVRARWREDHARVLASEVVRREVTVGQGEAARQVLSVLAPIASEDGVIGILGADIDVSAQRRAEQERARLAEIMESTSDLVGTSRVDGSVLYLNPAGRRLLGLALDAPLGGRRIYEFHPAWVQELLVGSALPTAIRAGVWSGETAVLGPQGEEIPVHQLILAHRDGAGQVEYLSTVARDLRDWKLAQRRMDEQAQRLRMTVSSALDAVITADERGVVVAWDGQAEAIFGWRRDEAMGRELAELIVPPQHRAAHRAGMRRYLETGEARMIGRRVELSALRHDGREFPVELAIASARLGDRVLFTAFVRDLTARREADAALRATEEQLQRALRLEALGRLASGVARDFNNLLTTILGFTDLTLDQLPGEHPARGDLGEIKRAADRAAALTRQLLAFGRRQLLEPRVVDVNAAVTAQEATLRRLLGDAIGVTLDLDPTLGPVRVDQAQLGQVLEQLALNARDAMPEGGELRLTTRNVDIGSEDARRHAEFEPGRYVLFSVSDTGVGMDEAALAQAFEPFYSTQPPGRGTGLGLPMVYGIMRQHRGTVLLRSKLGAGTTVEIYLPRAVEAERSEPPRSRAGGKETVLLVAPDPRARSVTERALRNHGFRLIVAADADEALAAERWHQAPIDLLLTDLVLPRRSGAELASALRRLRPMIRVLFLSGDGAAAAAGPDDAPVLARPFSAGALAARVRETLDAPIDHREAGG